MSWDVVLVKKNIYRGKRQYEKRLSLQKIFSENSEQKREKLYAGTDYQLQPSVNNEKRTVDNANDKHKLTKEFEEVIDVIAVIQEINAE